MKTNRFETFLDAILAIIITVLVLKLAQPEQATWGAIWDLKTGFVTYLISFLIIFNIWYNDHNLFQLVEEIDNKVVMTYGVLIFVISLLPYFATWLNIHIYSIPAQTMFGLIFIVSNILYSSSTYLIYNANRYNPKFKQFQFWGFQRYLPIAIILFGFVLTYTIFIPGIYVCCLIAVILWIFIARIYRPEFGSSERFEALIDAIVAIILTVIVLEITMATNGSWEALFDLRVEFIAYAISFVVCFNYWNFNNNLFSIVNKIDHKVIWSIGIALFALSLIPFLTTFVSENFYSFVAQACYGFDFIIVAILSIITSKSLKNADKGNIALQLMLKNDYQFISTLIIVAIGFIIGYLTFPPAIMISCLISIFLVWLIPHFKRIF